MEFKKYQHVERIGTSETEGLLNGVCYIFPKIDGTNSSCWLNNNKTLGCGSRNRVLSLSKDNAGFKSWAIEQEGIFKLLTINPEIRLYGEWLVPHTLKTYEDSAWRQFYVFDVMFNDSYMKYEDYQPVLEKFGIKYIAPICKVENPTYERIVEQLDKNNYLIKDGNGVGEGVVVKNYSFVNIYGRTTWGKIVRNEFKTEHRKNDVNKTTERSIIEEAIASKYVTTALIEKEFSKIENECGWTSKMIPRLLNTVFYCLVTEEAWNFVKDNKNPTINFKTLSHFTVQKIKEIMPQLFN